MEKVNLNKRVYAKNQYEKVIDTKFSQLATTLFESYQDGKLPPLRCCLVNCTFKK